MWRCRVVCRWRHVGSYARVACHLIAVTGDMTVGVRLSAELVDGLGEGDDTESHGDSEEDDAEDKGGDGRTGRGGHGVLREGEDAGEPEQDSSGVEDDELEHLILLWSTGGEE